MAGKLVPRTKSEGMRILIAVEVFFLALDEVAGHAALVTPPSRNAVDRFLPEFTRGKVLRDEHFCQLLTLKKF